MALDSALFLFFFLPPLLAAHALCPAGLRNLLLFAAGLLFYAWGDAAALPLLLGSVGFNWLAGLWLERIPAPARGPVTALAVVANLAPLVWTKYFAFLLTDLLGLDPAWVKASGLAAGHLPLGVSFFTFSCVAYVMDVARGAVKAERNVLDLGLFVTFFPKITAGPIARFQDMAGALKDRRMTWEGVSQGGYRFAVGLAKKVLVAACAGRVADAAFERGGLDMPTAWIGLLAYTLQIYFDFSGYTDMAVGLGRMFGFVLPENFDHPYASRSIQEFWRRWHMSLSSWFRDYLYIPLGGGRVAPWRVYLNLVTVFVVCGLWHGASLSFLVWGLWHGLFLALERAGLGGWLKRAPRPLAHGYALLAVMLGWVFFRAESLAKAGTYLAALFSFSAGGIEYFAMNFLTREFVVVAALGVVLALPTAPLLAARLEAGGGLSRGLVHWGRAVALPVLFVLAAMQMAVSTFTPFIYAKF
jgi:alginate O-acetyltransferase complex protein AlgI